MAAALSRIVGLAAVGLVLVRAGPCWSRRTTGPSFGGAYERVAIAEAATSVSGRWLERAIATWHRSAGATIR